MLIAAQFVIAKHRKLPKWPSQVDKKKKVTYSFNRTLYSSGSQLGAIVPPAPKDICLRLETFLVVTARRQYYPPSSGWGPGML